MNDKFPKSTEAKEQNLNEAKFDTKGVDKDIKDVEIDYLKKQVADKQETIDSMLNVLQNR